MAKQPQEFVRVTMKAGGAPQRRYFNLHPLDETIESLYKKVMDGIRAVYANPKEPLYELPDLDAAVSVEQIEVVEIKEHSRTAAPRRRRR